MSLRHGARYHRNWRRGRHDVGILYTHVADRLAVAARLAAKAVAAHGSARILTPDPATTDALDRLLWVAPATGFLPHCRIDSPVAGQTPVEPTSLVLNGVTVRRKAAAPSR